MTKEDTIQILDLIEDVLSRCTNDLYIPHPSGEGDYNSYIASQENTGNV
jgi:hypothetical protein